MSLVQLQPGSSGPSTYQAISPRERMRLAKAALMEDEDQEVEFKRERRRSRRASSIAMSAESESTDLSRRASMASLGSMASLPETCSPAGSTRGKQPGRSILRSSFACPSAFPASASTSSLDSYTALPPPISRHSTSTTDFGPPCVDYDDSTPRAMRRRSSKVRFSDKPLPPANSATASATSAAESSPSPTSKANKYAMRRASSIEGLREDLARTQRQLSYTIDPRASFASFSSAMSDPFAYCAGSPMSTSSLDFSAQPLPYPKPRRPSRLSVGSTSLAQTSDRDSVSSSTSSPATPLRDVLARSSLNGPGTIRTSTASFAPSARDSLASISSTLASASAGSSDESSPTRSLPIKYSTLLPSAKNAVDPERVPRFNRDEWRDPDLGLSPRSGPSPAVQQEDTCPQSLPVPGTRSSITSSDHLTVPGEIMPDSHITPLKMGDPFELLPVEPLHVPEFAATQTVEPQIEHAETALEAPASPETPPRTLHIDSIDLLPPAPVVSAVSVVPSMKSIHHSRSESALSDALNGMIDFPLPPARQLPLEVTFLADTFVRNSMPNNETPAFPAVTEISLDTPRPDSSNTSTFSTPPAIVSPPSSPELAPGTTLDDDLAEEEPRSKNIFVRSPILSAAVDNGILSPNSRLLKYSSSKRPSFKRAVSDSFTITQSGGWSGSESEEEDFVQAIRSITLRKLSAPRSRPALTRSATTSSASLRIPTLRDLAPPPMSVAMRPDGSDRLSSLSHTSSTSGISSVDSAGPVTPGITEMPGSIALSRKASSSSSSSTVPGDFPWGGSAPSSPTGSVRSGKSGHSQSSKTFYEGLQNLDKSLKEVKRRQSSLHLPEPKNKVKGWGKPEVLIDNEWTEGAAPSPASTLSWSDNVDHARSPSPTYTHTTATPMMSGGITPRARLPSPDLAGGISTRMGLGMGIGGGGEGGWGSLLDEEEMEFQTGLAL